MINANHSPEYTVRFPEPARHLAEITVAVDARGEPALEFWMPVWTPGSYLVREYARNVEAFSASGGDGAVLRWEKARKNVWRVETGDANAVTVRYRVYGREKSVRTNWIDADHAFLVGAGTFLAVRGRETGEHRVRVEKPPGWRDIATGLPSRIDGPTEVFVAADLDALVDSPFLIGTLASYSFEVDGKPVALVNHGEGGLWDGAKAARDVETIVRAYRDMYGGLPFDRYVFLNLLVEGRGGLEHNNSCVLMASRFAFRARKNYVDWLALASHEFFHVWNVKRSRPVELGPFDYENEVYTRSLWVAEGITNYYTDLVPRRAGLTTPEEYLDLLGGNLDKLDAVPGRFLQSLEDASFDAWIKLYRPDENTGNSTVSYYLKGGVVGWLLDAEIRRATGGARSLDDLMRLLFERYGGERGFSGEDVQRAAEELAGASLEEFFARAVRSTRELDYAPAVAWFGLRRRQLPADAVPWLGIAHQAVEGRLRVMSLRSDGPAAAAGLNAEDEILAVGGYRVTAETFADRLAQYAPGERIEFLISRNDVIRIVPVTLGAQPPKWKLEADPEAPAEAAARREAWMGAAAT